MMAKQDDFVAENLFGFADSFSTLSVRNILEIGKRKHNCRNIKIIKIIKIIQIIQKDKNFHEILKNFFEFSWKNCI